MLTSNPEEATQTSGFSWNTHVLASVAFPREDRAPFDLQYEAHRLATEPDAANATNLKMLTGLAKCFGKSYREAYGRWRPND